MAAYGNEHSMQNLAPYRDDPFNPPSASPSGHQQNYDGDGGVQTVQREFDPYNSNSNNSPYVSTTHIPPAGTEVVLPSDAPSRGAYVPAANLMASNPFATPMNSSQRLYDRIDRGAFDGRFNAAPMPARTGRKKKWFFIGAIVVLVLAVVGVIVGVVASKSHSTSKTSSASSSSSGPSVVNQTDPNDPSTFQPDSALKKSFYGLAYTPAGSQLPNCGNNLSSVITDIQLMSQLTTQIRIYGADCNQSALVLEAIKQTKVDMTVFLANYNLATDNHTAYLRQRDEITAAIQTYGTDHIGGVTVGNEFMLDYLTANGATDPNSAVGNTGAAILKADIEDMRQTLAAMNLPKTLPVGTADAGSYFNTMVLEDVDYAMSNVHAWFANQSINNAAGWVSDFFENQNVLPAAQLSNNPKMYIAETGWPTQSSDAADATNGASAASEANLQIFLNTFVCQANTNGTGYFFFEFFDEPWKDVEFGGVEGWWGLFHSNRTLKNIVIPDCVLS